MDKLTNSPTTEKQPVEKLAYSVDEAAVALGLSKSYVRELTTMGKIKSLKVGRRRLISRGELMRFLGIQSG